METIVPGSSRREARAHVSEGNLIKTSEQSDFPIEFYPKV